jgi:hypothetical protein
VQAPRDEAPATTCAGSLGVRARAEGPRDACRDGLISHAVCFESLCSGLCFMLCFESV